MNTPLRLFDFPATEHPAIIVARLLADDLATGTVITRKSLSNCFVAVNGSSDADNRWSVRDMNAAIELGQLFWLRDHGRIQVTDPADTAFAAFSALAGMVPAQHNRSEEQVELQQFSTPLALSWIAARAAAIRSNDVVLEPSAGTGMLAIWPQTLGAKIILNEITPLRRECLHALFPKLSVTFHDGELIDELLNPSLLPSVVLINPPFSVGLERGHDGRTGARHVRSAFRRLRAGGRLVAIMPEWFDATDFKSSLSEPLSIRLNMSIERAFARQGTGITTRLIVIDKVACDKATVAGRAESLRELVQHVDQIVPRSSLHSVTVPRTLEATRIVDEDRGDTLNAGAKSAALSVFEGTKQRFFAQLLLSMKLPSLLPAIQTSLTEGHAVVVQLVSTAEAMLNRRLADLTPEEREHLDIDLSPREYVVDYLMKSFPVRLMQVFTDENGDPRSEPMSDGDGNPVLCRRALDARDRMVEQLCALPPIATALDAIIERFGVDQVAEVTGRTKRLIVASDGKQKLQSRTPRANLLETQAFNVRRPPRIALVAQETGQATR